MIENNYTSFQGSVSSIVADLHFCNAGYPK